MHSVSASLPSSADVNDASTLIKRNQNCQATDEGTGESCGETKSLHILDEFRKLYESRIEEVDQISDGESDRVSVSITNFLFILLHFTQVFCIDSRCSESQLENVNFVFSMCY